jgi:hypothetical protein
MGYQTRIKIHLKTFARQETAEMHSDTYVHEPMPPHRFLGLGLGVEMVVHMRSEQAVRDGPQQNTVLNKIKYSRHLPVCDEVCNIPHAVTNTPCRYMHACWSGQLLCVIATAQPRLAHQ